MGSLLFSLLPLIDLEQLLGAIDVSTTLRRSVAEYKSADEEDKAVCLFCACLSSACLFFAFYNPSQEIIKQPRHVSAFSPFCCLEAITARYLEKVCHQKATTRQMMPACSLSASRS